jgi:hypothetical protein
MVYVRTGQQAIVAGMGIGDIVFFYELKTGKEPVGSIPCPVGRQGIVTIGEVTSKSYPLTTNPVQYKDGTQISWACLDADIICDKGFVPRIDVNRYLGYRLAYNLHGFGTNHSGIVEINLLQARALKSIFCNNVLGCSCSFVI